jgi:hypothetical protein
MLTADEPWLVLFPFWSDYGGVSLESLVSIYCSLVLDTASVGTVGFSLGELVQCILKAVENLIAL